MSSDIIKEFLVGLGFKVDQGGLKKFVGGIDAATKVAIKAGAAAGSMAVAVEAAVVKVSKQFEDLYYASQRLHSSVENIRAVDYEISQFGGDAKGARAAMEGIASLIRSNPGGENFIRSLGVETRDANGDLRDTAELMRDLGARFRNMPYYMAKVRAGVLGIDEITLQAMIRNTGEFSDQYHDMAARVGVDQQAAAKASHDFMVQVRMLLTWLTLLSEKLILAAQNSEGLARVAGTLSTVFEALARLAGRVTQWLGDADRATGGWSTTLLVLAGILAAVLLVLDPVVVGVLAIGAAIVALIDDFQTWREGGKSLIDWSAWSAEIDHVLAALKPLWEAIKGLVALLGEYGAAAAKFLGPYISNIARAALEGIAGTLHLITNLIRIITALLRGDWAGAWAEAKKGTVQYFEDLKAVWDKFTGKRDAPGRPNAPAAAAGSPAAGAAPPNAVSLAGQVEAFFRAKGLSAQQAQGIAAGIWAESRFDANALGPNVGKNGKISRAYGIGQWLGSRRAELFRRYGQRPTLQQQLEFMAWELNGGDAGGAAVLRQTTASGALDAYVRQFMRPAQGAETVGDLARGAQYLSAQMKRPVLATSPAGASVSVSQKTDIHVNGSADPAGTARAVAGEQVRVNGDLVRNAKGALR
jgi:hypothetical protein